MNVETTCRSALRKGTWALAAVLTAGLLTACEQDRPVTGPERERTPSESAANAEVKTQSELEGRISPAAVPHWADGYAWANQPTSASYNPVRSIPSTGAAAPS